jgi:hypothetical protein
MLDRSAKQAVTAPELLPDAFLQCLASGGDERLLLNESGENKYYVNPVQLDVFNRGSCTCSPATRDGLDAAIALFHQLTEGTIGFEEARLEQRNRLLRLNNADAKQTEVVFAPSGTDCCYFAPYLSATLWPNKKITNVVTCPEELGSGSILAHQAKYYSKTSQVALSLSAGERVSASLHVDYRPLAARSNRGDIIDHTETIERIIERAGSDTSTIINLVVGSKSGIEDGLTVVEKFRGSRVIWTVDLCQLRTSPALVRKLIELGCILFLTGSKFFQAAPFCSALLVPRKYIDYLAWVRSPTTLGFETLFSRYDFPSELTRIRPQFPPLENRGLLLRWEMALREIELFAEIPVATSLSTIKQWNRQVVEAISQNRRFERLSDQERTNESIISFRVRSRSGQYLNHGQLAEVHRRIAATRHSLLDTYVKTLIGQPVAYGNGSFIRLAIGAHDVRRFARDGFDFTDDQRLIETMDQISGAVAD